MLGLVEFFCGIGGVAEACRQLGQGMVPVHAIDIDQRCGEVYRENFGTTVQQRTIESLDFSRLAAVIPHADVWWLSPPCQPYCRRGRGECDADPRCLALRAIIGWLERERTIPLTRLALENVPEFADSRDAKRLIAALRRQGFAIWAGTLCPTQFGVPNRRQRYYLIARRDVAEITPPVGFTPSFNAPDVHAPRWRFTIAEILDEYPSAELRLAPELIERYRSALDIVDPSQCEARAACFASGYGKSLIRSGSYLRDGDRLRRFSPAEVARLLGFSQQFRFPDHLSTRHRWKMLGNSVSIPPVKAILASLAAPPHDAESKPP